MVQQFNLNVERQLPGNVVLTAGYAGTRSAHILVGQSNENLIISECVRSDEWTSIRLYAGLWLPDVSLCGSVPEP